MYVSMGLVISKRSKTGGMGTEGKSKCALN